MSFSDPTTLNLGSTVSQTGGTATALAVTDRSAPFTGLYASSDGLTKLKVSHSYGSRKRSEMRLDLVTTYTDPTTGLAKDITASAYLVLNRPNAGFTSTQLKSLTTGICGYFGVAANMDSIIAGES